MPNPVWPATLPTHILARGFSERLPKNVIRTPMDAGPPKKRRRGTAAVKPMTATVELDQAQAATLETFFRDTCADGALNFDWVHPRTQATVTFGWGDNPPQFVPAEGTSGALYYATLELEVMP